MSGIAIEVEIARLTSTRATDEELCQIAELAWEVDLAYDNLPREYNSLSRLDYTLHEKIASAAKSKCLLEAWRGESVLAQMVRAGKNSGTRFPCVA